MEGRDIFLKLFLVGQPNGGEVWFSLSKLGRCAGDSPEIVSGAQEMVRHVKRLALTPGNQSE